MLAPLSLVLQAAGSDPVPDDNDVTAGWVGALVLVLLVVAVVFLLRSFTKQLKKVEKADEAGLYDADPRVGDQQTPEHPDLPPTTAEQDH